MAVKDGKEYVTYVAKRFVTYIDTPADEKRRIRTEAKLRREPWLVRWFGWAPYGIVLWWRARQERHALKHQESGAQNGQVAEPDLLQS